MTSPAPSLNVLQAESLTSGEVRFTPGPWASYPCNLEKYSQVITAKGATVQIADVGIRGDVALTKSVWGDRVTYAPGEETTANARLITAAPDLYAALKGIAATSSDISDETLKRYASGEFDHKTTAEAAAMLAARAALAKATGERA